MALDIKIATFEKHFEVIVTGMYDLEQAGARFPHVLSVCKLTGLSNVLIDFTELEGVPAATEKLIYTMHARDLYERHVAETGQHPKIAYLGSPPSVSTYEPGIDIIEGSGISAGLFTNRYEAYEWLGVKPT